MGPNEYSLSHLNVSTCTIVSFFSRITLREDQGGIWQHKTKQRKEKRNRTERKGRAFRHGLFSFHFQLSSFTPTLILPGLVLFSCSGRNQQTNETACVLFFFLPAVRNCLLACFDETWFFLLGCYSRERAQLNCNGWIVFCSLTGFSFLGDWNERVSFNDRCVFFLRTKGKKGNARRAREKARQRLGHRIGSA